MPLPDAPAKPLGLFGDLPFVPAACIDLHVHSAFSNDALGTLEEIARAARAKGVGGAVLTEHDTMRHRSRIETWNRDHAPDDTDFRFYVGTEVSATGGHILGIGIQETIPYGRSPAETIELIEDQGAVAVPAHPGRRGSGIGYEAVERLHLDPTVRLRAIEVHNAQELWDRNETTAALAERLDLGGTGGSDAHQVYDVGNAYTLFPEPVCHLDDMIRQLQDGRTWGTGTRTGLPTLLRQGTRNLIRRVRGKLRPEP